ncbi:MAG: hypothetical protein M3O33_09820 [Cyanobacteriota bacterium]|nr:hypothetical protein [Cyanobacteriota bacterium]
MDNSLRDVPDPLSKCRVVLVFQRQWHVRAAIFLHSAIASPERSCHKTGIGMQRHGRSNRYRVKRA